MSNRKSGYNQVKSLKIKHYTIPIFIPHLGCPFNCVFCDQDKITGKILSHSQDNITDIIEKYLQTVRKENSIIEVGFFGGSFTGLSLEIQEEYLQVVLPFIKKQFVQSVRISTRPDFINKDGLKLLKKYGVKTVELGAQSFDNEVLLLSGRGHTAEDIIKASLLIKESCLNLGLQMMIGLPGDSLEKAIYTAEKITELKADCTRIYPAVVIKRTELEEIYLRGEYKPLDLSEAIRWASEIFRIFEKAGIPVIRMGLHPSEGLLTGENLAAGPFHPSFRELVRTEIWKKNFSSLIEKKSEGGITIFINPDEINHAVGYNSDNRKLLEKSFKKVIFKTDSNLSGREYRVDYY